MHVGSTLLLGVRVNIIKLSWPREIEYSAFRQNQSNCSSIRTNLPRGVTVFCNLDLFWRLLKISQSASCTRGWLQVLLFSSFYVSCLQSLIIDEGLKVIPVLLFLFVRFFFLKFRNYLFPNLLCNNSRGEDLFGNCERTPQVHQSTRKVLN